MYPAPMTTITTHGRNWAMLAHVAGTVNQLFLPSFGFLGPGLVWLLKRDDAEVAPHARSAFLFQLEIGVSTWVLLFLGAVLSCFLVGWLFWLAGAVVWISGLAFPLFGAIRVNNERTWSYPLVGSRREPPELTG